MITNYYHFYLLSLVLVGRGGSITGGADGRQWMYRSTIEEEFRYENKSEET